MSKSDSSKDVQRISSATLKSQRISSTTLKVPLKKLRQLSSEGLQVVLPKSERDSVGLEVDPNWTPPVLVQEYEPDDFFLEKAVRSKFNNRFLTARVFGIRIIWIMLTMSIFLIGILLGVVIVTTTGNKRKDSAAVATQSMLGTIITISSSFHSSQSSPTSHSAQSTQLSHAKSLSLTLLSLTTTTPPRTTSTSITTPSTISTTSFAATSTLPDEVSTSSPSASETSIQAFTGALGGIFAPAITSTGNSGTFPFLVGDSGYPNMTLAIEQSCNDQFDKCQEVASQSGAFITLSQCNDQKSACLSKGSILLKG